MSAKVEAYIKRNFSPVPCNFVLTSFTIFCPIFTEEILFVPKTFKEWNCTKTKPPVLLQKLLLITAFLEKMKTVKSIPYILFQHIPVKSPHDFPMNNCTLDLLKRVLSKYKPTTIDGLWKTVKEEWQVIPPRNFMESRIQIWSPETILSDWTLKNLIFTF